MTQDPSLPRVGAKRLQEPVAGPKQKHAGGFRSETTDKSSHQVDRALLQVEFSKLSNPSSEYTLDVSCCFTVSCFKLNEIAH